MGQLPKKRPTKSKLEAEKLKREGQKAVITLESITNSVLEPSDVAKYNKIVRSEKGRRFLPKKAKNLLTEIYNRVDDASKKKLLKM